VIGSGTTRIFSQGQRAALVVATEGAPPDRGDAVALIFEHLYWISRNCIGRCSRDEAIKYRNELKAMEPHRHTVAKVENHARKWWQQRGLRTPRGAGMNKTPIRWSTYTKQKGDYLVLATPQNQEHRGIFNDMLFRKRLPRTRGMKL
jgi:hypothetical protein